MYARESKAKTSREKLNQTRVERSLEVGSHVLMKVLGRSGVFQASWDGPNEVARVLSNVNYLTKGDGLPTKGRVAHINNLKVYKERCVYRAVVAIEEESSGAVGNGVPV